MNYQDSETSKSAFQLYLVLHDVRLQQVHLLLYLAETLMQIPTVKRIKIHNQKSQSP